MNNLFKRETSFLDKIIPLFLIAAILILLFIAYKYVFYKRPSKNNVTLTPTQNVIYNPNFDKKKQPAFKPIESKVRKGDFNTALEEFKNLSKLKDKLDKTEYAKAFFSISGVVFRDSGRFEVDTLEKVLNEYKRIITDPEVELKTRAKMANALATSIWSAGRDPRVEKIIFSGEPFESFYVEGDMSKSSMLTLQWSYKLYPTSRAAIGIASWNVQELLSGKKMSDNRKNELLSNAKKWLNIAQRLERREGVFKRNTKQDAAYAFWKAYVISALAEYGVEEYKDTWRKEFTRVLQYLENIKNKAAQNAFLAAANLTYAYFIHSIDKDKESARFYVNRAIDYDKKAPLKPSSLDMLIYNFNKYPDTGHIARIFKTLQAEYPEFNEFTRHVIKDVENRI